MPRSGVGYALRVDADLPQLPERGRRGPAEEEASFRRRLAADEWRSGCGQHAFHIGQQRAKEGTTALVGEFESGVAAGNHTAQGWPSSAYRVSKAALNALTRILAQQSARVRINSFGTGTNEKWVGLMVNGSDPAYNTYMSLRSSNQVTAGFSASARKRPR